MIKIKRILCPTDLSEDSDDAMLYAVALAKSYGAKLYPCYWADTLSHSHLTEGAREFVNRLFANSITQHLGHARLDEIDWEGVVTESGSYPAEAITREAAERGIDLIVMRSRRRPQEATAVDSVAEAVWRTAPCPVLVTHQNEREWVSRVTGKINLRRVLVAYDFSDDSERALSHAVSIAEEHKSELHILNVLPGVAPNGNGAELFGGSENIYHQTMRRLQKAMPSEAIKRCKMELSVRWGRPYQQVLSYAKEHEINLICMGAQGADFSMQALFGSNVDRVLRQAPCPVLVMRPLRLARPAHLEIHGGSYAAIGAAHSERA